MPDGKPSAKKPFRMSEYLNIAAFDLFGSPVQFNINGDESFKTTLGVFWSILMVASMSFAIAFYVSIYYYKSDVDVTQISDV